MRLYSFILAVALIFGAGGFLARHYFLSASLMRPDDAMQRQIAVIEKQLAELEPQIENKKVSLEGLYDHLLQTNGRLSLKTILADNSSRLALAGATLRGGRRAREGEAAVSRTYARGGDDFDITTLSAVTAYELDLAFAGTPLEGLGEAFVRAELKTGINALFIAAVAVIESDWGHSALASERNNLFGFGAYDGDVDKAQAFSSKQECVLHVAVFLREHYIDGSYFRGHSVKAVNELYASDKAWADKVLGAMRRIDRMIREKSA